MPQTADFSGAGDAAAASTTSGTEESQTLKMEIVGRLAAGLAHDFNNLLTIINGQSQWMLDHLRDGDPSRRGLEEILRAGQQGAELTRQLLAFSRQQPVEPQWFDLNQLLDRLGFMLARLLERSVILEFQTRAVRPCLFADPHQLEQVVLNLAVNARDAMPKGGSLIISTDDVEIGGSSYLCLSVRDTGTGIVETARHRMFEPFFTTKPAGKGTGLGLTQVREVVKNSGGHIEIDTEVGRGTAVRLYWKSRAETKITPAMKPARIVIADDYPAIRNWIRHVLESECQPVEICEAVDGAEALRLVREGGVDLVITDLIMPETEGIETIQTIRLEAPHVPVVAISGSLHPEYLQMARVLGATATLQKPLTAEDLLSAIKLLLPNRRPA